MKINKNITPMNRWTGRFGDSVEWIVLHYTGNPCTYGPDTAKGEAQYFADEYRGASAHFFVDQSEIWQSVELQDTAWHCGDAPSKNGCRNTNSIGIEMCVLCEGGVYSIPEATMDLAAELTRYLLTLYPNAQICRHYDVTGKICPEPWVRNPVLWEIYKDKVTEDEPMTPAEKKAFEALAKKVKALESSLVSSNKNIDSLAREVAAIDERTERRYNDVRDCPKWLRPTVEKLVEDGSLKGDENGNLALTYDLARALVICDREGAFDK